MKRVGLITMHRVVNCGSQLQTYALSKIVESLGYHCDVIDYQYPSLYHYRQRASCCDWRSLKGLVKLILLHVGLLKVAQFISLKRSEWRMLPKMKLGWEGVRLTRKFDMQTIKHDPPTFDIYLVGSDQVWNPNYIIGDYTYLLDFAPDCKRRIAYSSSFGIKELPESERKSYARLLSRFDAIGTREPSGVKILDSLGVRAGVAVLDPTMLMSIPQWEEYSTKRRLYHKKYVFCYILSYVFKSTPWVIKYAKEVAEALDCEVVFYGGGEYDCIADAKAAGFVVLEAYITPQNLVRYYLDAEYIVANGFHGTAFSITLDKHYTIVTNPNYSDDDRVMSLLERTECVSRSVKCGAADYDVSREWLIGERPARESFERLKAKSMEFLSCALAGASYPGTFLGAYD